MNYDVLHVLGIPMSSTGKGELTFQTTGIIPHKPRDGGPPYAVLFLGVPERGCALCGIIFGVVYRILFLCGTFFEGVFGSARAYAAGVLRCF